MKKYKDKNYVGIWAVKKSDKNNMILVNVVGKYIISKIKRIVSKDYFTNNFYEIK